MVILRTVLIDTLDRYQAVVSKLEHGMVETLRVEGGERARVLPVFCNIM
jgi:hypothetical protein